MGGAQHAHTFAPDCSTAERRTRLVIAITAAMMVIEIVAGTLFHSMALLADGWHMSTHVAAFLIIAVAYYQELVHVTIETHLCSGTEAREVAIP